MILSPYEVRDVCTSMPWRTNRRYFNKYKNTDAECRDSCVLRDPLCGPCPRLYTMIDVRRCTSILAAVPRAPHSTARALLGDVTFTHGVMMSTVAGGSP